MKNIVAQKIDWYSSKWLQFGYIVATWNHPMQRERLTPTRINAFKCPEGKGQAFLFDTEMPRLGVRVTPQQSRSFVFETKLDRQTIRKTIGSTSTWTTEAARIEARRLQKLVDEKIDPREHEKALAYARAASKAAEKTAKQEEEARSKYTLSALCEAYCKSLDARDKKKSAAAARSVFKCHVSSQPQIAALAANAVTAIQVAELVRNVRATGKERSAGVLRSYLSAAYNAAKEAPLNTGASSELAAFRISTNPVQDIKAIPVHAGTRTLAASELKKYVLALNDDSPIDAALKVALYAGGQRMAQLLRAKVSDFDDFSQTLRLWDGKGRRTRDREHLLPLAPEGTNMVKRLIVRALKLGTPWLFSSFGTDPIAESTPGKRVVEISKQIGGEAFDLRDLRRTCETMLASMGVYSDIRAQLLSHGLSGVQQMHYDKHSYTNEKRDTLASWEMRLAQIVSGVAATNNVFALREAEADPTLV